jgi:abhydrolase domain-containing protein 17
MNKNTLNRLLWGEFSLKRMIRSALLIYAALCIYAYFFSDRQIFLPQPSTYQDSQDVLKLTTADGIQISARYLPNPTAKYTLLYSHGNAEDLGDILPILNSLRDLGFSVLAYDYRGYGTSGGMPSENGVYLDIDAAYNYLTQQLKIPPNRIILYGRSVGGGPAVDLAVRKPVAGLIVESTFVSAFRVVTKIPIVPFDKFANLDKIKQVRVPILIMHGTSDEVIPFWHGQKLYEAANQPKRYLWIEAAEHNNFKSVAGDRFAVSVREFVGLVEEQVKGDR